MNILIITPLLPYPLNSGGAQAQYNIIEQLRHSHTITLVYPENNYNNQNASKELQKKWKNVKLIAYPYSAQLCHFPFFLSKIKRAFNLYIRPNARSFKTERILTNYGFPLHKHFINFLQLIIKQEKPQVVQTEFYPYLPLIEHLQGNFKTLFVHHEIRYIRNERMMEELVPSAKELLQMQNNKEKELKWLNCYDGIITLTPIDKNILAKDGVNKPIFISPAAINTSLFSYKEQGHYLCFLGSATHIPNVEGMQWFTQKVLPLLPLSLQKKLTIDVIGSGWNETAFAKNTNAHFVFHGFVKDLSVVANGKVMIVPILSGSGMRMKILEAAALSMPVITTSVGVEGLSFEHNKDCLIANSPHLFAQAIQQLIENPALKQSLAQQAQQVFRNNYSVEASANTRNNIYINIYHV